MKRSVAVAFVAALTGCSMGPMTVSSSPHDPSSPAASEGVDPLSLAETSPAAATPPGAPSPHAHGEEGAAPAAAYVCPMHPDVTSPTPGECPKCHMKLVPKQ